VRHDEPEHRITEELESFVGFGFAVLGAPGAVRERTQ